ncbi:MAG: polyprenyl synthetase family protein [Bacteroidia bacterium]|nr:polyprenyl synthetase family protein [Bacteroidia bacterium]
MTENIVTSDSFEQYLISHPFIGKPENLYNSMNYIMQLGGKRMRPKLLMLAYKHANGLKDENALKLALAIETFHNFSLVHDDIMDKAPIRRGKKTVHEEWNIPTAILAGDNLFIKCFELILNSGFDNRLELLNVFTKMSSLVCDGQQMDMNLPEMEFIDEQDYLGMIELKTAVLPACALKMGALAAGVGKEVAEKYYQLGINIGMAFQLQDDYLDVFGTEEEIGKQEGGDIIENKKTILFIHAIRTLNQENKRALLAWYHDLVHDQAMKIEQVRNYFKLAGSDAYLSNLKSQYEQSAIEILEQLEGAYEYKKQFELLFNILRSRNS